MLAGCAPSTFHTIEDSAEAHTAAGVFLHAQIFYPAQNALDL